MYGSQVCQKQTRCELKRSWPAMTKQNVAKGMKQNTVATWTPNTLFPSTIRVLWLDLSTQSIRAIKYQAFNNQYSQPYSEQRETRRCQDLSTAPFPRGKHWMWSTNRCQSGRKPTRLLCCSYGRKHSNFYPLSPSSGCSIPRWAGTACPLPASPPTIDPCHGILIYFLRQLRSAVSNQREQKSIFSVSGERLLFNGQRPLGLRCSYRITAVWLRQKNILVYIFVLHWICQDVYYRYVKI